MELGNILYLHIIDFEPILLVTQEINKDRFCKVINAIPVKGGRKDEQYMKYQLQSLTTNKIYEINNYLSPYQAKTIEELENILKENEDFILPERLIEMYQTIEAIKNMIKE